MLKEAPAEQLVRKYGLISCVDKRVNGNVPGMMNRIAAICPCRWIWAPDQMMGLAILVRTRLGPVGRR
jgi:hypothetical protein